MSADLPRLVAALSDRYQVEREVGQGGMATVYQPYVLDEASGFRNAGASLATCGGRLRHVPRRCHGCAFDAVATDRSACRPVAR